MKIISTINLLAPKEVCTDSYLCVGVFKSTNDAVNMYEYFKTKFVRFLMMQAISSINLSKEKFYFVPIQDFNQKWDDQLLYKKYALSSSEIEFIESSIKSMD
jgi:site-specific DNA-methyltransferase (adenine-specific)